MQRSRTAPTSMPTYSSVRAAPIVVAWGPGRRDSGEPAPRSVFDGNVQLGEQLSDPALNVVADGTDVLDTPAGRIVKLPVEVALAGEERTCVAASHRDDDVGGPDHLIRPRLR